MHVWLSGICVSDGNTDAMSGDGRLLRLDSSVDMKLGDLGGIVTAFLELHQCVCVLLHCLELLK